MSDPFTPAERAAIMRRVRSKHTSAEMKARRALTAMGLRYRLHRRDLPGAPDVVFPGRRAALFVHGCFWHGHACRRGARLPAANAAYWAAKIARNVARDARQTAALSALGWTPLTVWECELKGEAAAVRLQTLLAQARPGRPARPGARAQAASSCDSPSTPTS